MGELLARDFAKWFSLRPVARKGDQSFFGALSSKTLVVNFICS
jgi:hypothetical protein